METIDISTMSLEDKVQLFKDLVDDLDIIITAAYGAEGYISSEDVHYATRDTYGSGKQTALFVDTDICTG